MPPILWILLYAIVVFLAVFIYCSLVIGGKDK